jgi:hypothetical protein
VELSESGKKLHAALRAKHQAMALSWLEPLSPNERENLLKMMAKIAQGAMPRAARTKVRVSGPQWRRQDHHDQDADDASQTNEWESGTGPPESERRAQRSAQTAQPISTRCRKQFW